MLLTGCTGFLGKIMLEKFLSACPDIATIYVMVRAKRGVEPMERVRNQILNSECFSELLLKFPNKQAFLDYAQSKIVPIQGDLLQEGLAMSEEDLQIVSENCNIIINSAASVSFDDPL